MLTVNSKKLAHQADNLSDVVRSEDEFVQIFLLLDLALVVLIAQVIVHVEPVDRFERIAFTNLDNKGGS